MTTITNTGVTTTDLTVDTTTLKVDSSNNRIGIGTSSPYTLLELSSIDPILRFNDSNGGTDTKNFELRYVGTTSPDIDGLYFRTANDANNSYSDKMSIFGSGAVTMPNQPVFSVSRTSNQATGSSYTAIQFQSGSSGTINEGGYWSFTNHRFTAPVAGKYEFAWGYGTNAPAGQTVYRSYLYVNGSEYQNSQLRNDSNPQLPPFYPYFLYLHWPCFGI